MSRSPWTRALAAVMAAWMLVVMTGRLHACPTHDGAALASTSGAHAAHAAHAAHGGAPTHGATHACTCLGDCCVAAVAAPPVAGEALVAVVATVAAPAPRAALLRYRPSAPEHARPPSLGPPALHVG